MSNPIIPPEPEDHRKKKSSPDEAGAEVSLSHLMEGMKRSRETGNPHEDDGKATPASSWGQGREVKVNAGGRLKMNRKALKGIDDFFSLEGQQEPSLDIELAGQTFKRLTGVEAGAGFLQNVQLSNDNGSSGVHRLLDFKRLFLFSKDFVMVKERHSTVSGVLIPILKRIVSLTLDNPKDQLVILFTLDDGKSITLRAANGYRKVLEDVVLREFLIPNMKL